MSRKNYPTQALTLEGLEENSSLKKMLQLVGAKKQVVDFGCATGYFAQLLAQNDCKVTGVEINPDAAEAAQQHCEAVIVADLDQVSVREILPYQKFDIAVFGDVLEHLRDPWSVLKETRQLLRPEGYVVASIPNIAHGAIRLALLQGEFEYTELGILDNSHLRFFTRKTVEELFEHSGYFLNFIDRTRIPIFTTSPLVPQVNKNNFDDKTIQQVEQDTEADTLQFILRAFPLSEEGKIAALDKQYSELTKSFEQAQSRLQQTQKELEHSQVQLQQTQIELRQAQTEIITLQTNQPWQLSKLWLKLKNHVKLGQ